jgi:hypothetical protein
MEEAHRWEEEAHRWEAHRCRWEARRWEEVHRRIMEAVLLGLADLSMEVLLLGQVDQVMVDHQDMVLRATELQRV